MARQSKLDGLRQKIGDVDLRIVELLAERARLASDIGKAKGDGAVVLDAAREQAVLAAARQANEGPLPGDDVENVFREIISACRNLQKPATVAYLGPEGTFSHEAARRQFGSAASYEPVVTLGEVFASVENGRSEFGVVSVENTTEGAVTPTLDGLADSRLNILAELVLPVEQCLLASAGTGNDIKRIVSHPQGLAQCRRYLAEHYPAVLREPVASTAAAARLAADEEGTAAIAGRLAANTYALEVVAASVQDDPSNVTRFLVVGDSPGPEVSGNCRTSLVVLVKDEVGVLERLLKSFASHGVNLSMLESRPLPARPWEYSFFIDVSGHVADQPVAAALAEIEEIALSTRLLGSYPVAS